MDIARQLRLHIGVDCAARHRVGELHPVADAENRPVRQRPEDELVATVAAIINSGQVGRQCADQSTGDARTTGDDQPIQQLSECPRSIERLNQRYDDGDATR